MNDFSKELNEISDEKFKQVKDSMIANLEKKFDNLKEENEELRKENEKLKQRNAEIEKENSFLSKKFDKLEEKFNKLNEILAQKFLGVDLGNLELGKGKASSNYTATLSKENTELSEALKFLSNF